MQDERDDSGRSSGNTADGGWELFPHKADIGVRGWGSGCEAAFENAALAMTAVIVDPSVLRPAESFEVRCRAESLDVLFYDWLNALVYEMATRRMLFCRFQVRFDGDELTRRLTKKASRDGHRPAATRERHRMAPAGGEWHAGARRDLCR
jgi:SHS2 domain-containing protein